MYTPSLYMHAGSCPCPDNKNVDLWPSAYDEILY